MGGALEEPPLDGRNADGLVRHKANQWPHDYDFVNNGNTLEGCKKDESGPV